MWSRIVLAATVAASSAVIPAPTHAPAPREASPAPSRASTRNERSVPFAIGETLSYDVSWSTFLTAGTATVTVREKRPSFESTAYYIVAEGQPNALLSRLYTVYYKADTLLDVYTLLSQRGSVFSQEGGRKRMSATRLDQAAHTARLEVTTATVVTKDFAIPPQAQDALSAIFVIRTLPLREGLKLTIPVVNADDVYRVQLAVAARERVTTPLGDLNAWKVTPTVLDGGSQVLGQGLVLWVSDDARRLPLRMQADMPVGRFVLTLRDARG
jgi:Protein of unknown function (DUF3108)